MSLIPIDTIEVIAQSVGISNLSPDVLPALAAHIEYIVLEMMQEAIKCMRHSRRTTLTTEDVDSALKLRNVEPIYGFASGDSMRFRRAAGHTDLFYIEETEVELKEVIEAPLPEAQLDTAVVSHWLAIEGVQTAIPENPHPEAIHMLWLPSDNSNTESEEEGESVDSELPNKHPLSVELQLYFEKITELTESKSESALFKEVLVSLATNSGIHPLVPYFTYFVADEVSRNLNNFSRLFALMRLVRSLLRNPHIHVEPYLHQFMPSVLTCLVARTLGHKLSDNHWDLRNFTANLVASICKRFGHVFHNLQTRVTTTLLHTFMDPTKALTQQYGAIQGLAALGHNVVRLIVIPNLEPYLWLLEPEMQLEKQTNAMKRHEAWLVYGALMRAAGLYLHDRLKMLPSLPSPTVCKSNIKVLTTISNKRKGSLDDTTQQPPLKKLATDNSTGGGNSPEDCNDLLLSRSSMNNNGGAGPSGRKEMTIGGLDKDVDNLYEYFGESMLSFVVPSSQASLFL